MSTPPVPFLAKTKVSWTGEQDGDLGFLENEVINVFHLVDEMWWQGSLLRNGAEGIFPKDFVNVVSAGNSAQETPTKDAFGRAMRSPQASPTPAAKQAIPLNATSPFGSPEKGRNSPDRSSQQNSQRNSPLKGSPHRMGSEQYSPPKKAFGSSPMYASYSGSPKHASFSGSPRHSNSTTPKKGLTPTKRAMHVSKSSPALHEDYDSPTKRMSQSQLFQSQVSHSQSQLYSQHVLSSGLTKESVQESDGSDLYESIAQKKYELEAQLLHLKQLEQSVKPSVSGESSYSSEDVFSSARPEAGAKHDTPFTELDDEAPPPPPKHKRAPFDADDFRASGATVDDMRLSARYPEELKNSIKSLQSDVLNLSELSATSAGSFLRHKYDRQVLDDVEEIDSRLNRSTMGDRNERERQNGDRPDRPRTLEDRLSRVLGDEENDVFEKRSKPNIFKMFKKKPEQNLMEQRLQQQPDDWQTVKVDLNRMNTLTSSDKQQRTKMVARSEGSFIVKPLDYVSEINASETFGPDDVEFGDLNVNKAKVAEFSDRYPYNCDFNDLISDISVKFGSWRPNQIRAVMMHLCKFHIVEETERISQTKPKLQELLATREATVFQINYLFKKLLEALRIPAEVVLGFWKKPNEFYHSDQFSINHCWLSVMVETDDRSNGCFRLIDIMCFQNGPICNIDGVNEFYFLTEPTALISTHIPSVIELQHVCPPVDLNVCFHLPRMYSSFEKSGLAFVNFNNSLTRMNDMEFFEADIAIPTDVELFTLIKTSRKTSNDYTLCQIYWKGQQRMAKIKAVLPEKESIGVLQIFSGAKGTQTHFDNIHELACVIPLYHRGKNKEFTFVPRYPTIRSQNNDLYIKHPQSSSLSVSNTYSFEVDVHPSMGLNSGSGLMNRDFKLVIESPSGKYTKLAKDEAHKPFGTYQSKLFCQEKGTYRGLVIGDSGNSWYVFAQWECRGV